METQTALAQVLAHEVGRLKRVEFLEARLQTRSLPSFGTGHRRTPPLLGPDFLNASPSPSFFPYRPGYTIVPWGDCGALASNAGRQRVEAVHAVQAADVVYGALAISGGLLDCVAQAPELGRLDRSRRADLPFLPHGQEVKNN